MSQPNHMRLSTRSERLLFVDWVHALCSERFGIAGNGGAEGAWTLDLVSGQTLTIRMTPPSFEIAIDSPPDIQAVVNEMIAPAFERAQAFDVGPGTWWSITFSTDIGISALTSLHFMRILSEHGQRRFQGVWTLCDVAVLTIKYANVETTPIVIPKFEVTATFLVPGPGQGEFTREAGQAVGTVLRTLLAFAMASPIQHEGMLHPASTDQMAEALKVTSDRSVSEIVADGVALGSLLAPISHGLDINEALNRVLGGIYSYEQALEQTSEFVAVVLFVSAMEALTVPNANWRIERLTKRFVAFMQDLCPDSIDATIAHANFAQAFGGYTSQRRFLEEIYSRRSEPLHTGHTQRRLGSWFGFAGNGTIRIALLSGLARSAIVSFVDHPFSSLVGHPIVDPRPLAAG